jgi:uncharacterized protein YihD (DUF1040 family)
MSDKQRHELLELLRKHWEEKPEYSFGELLAQITYLAAGHTECGSVSDQEFLDSLRKGWRIL